MHEIHEVPNGKKRDYLPLLLLADPAETMIDRYLDDSRMFVLAERGETRCEAVIRAAGELELMNIATDPAFERRGYASALIRHLAALFAPDYAQMLVGTSEDGAAFYERLGFRRCGLREGFFLTYPEPVIDQGKLLKDMVLLRLSL